MSQCRGTTKAGARCRRNAVEGSEFCPAHADQPSTGGAGSGSGRQPRTESKTGVDLILIGAVALALAALRRVIRLI